MTLQDLGNLGEFVGAIGVVVSFVFLASQIRQNTRALRDAAEKDMAQDIAGFLTPIIENDEVARIYRLGLQGWDKLNENERVRFSMLMFHSFFHYQHLYARYRRGQLDPEFWFSQWQVVLWYGKLQGVRDWWPRARDRFSPSFVRHVEAEAMQGGPAEERRAAGPAMAPQS